jgi:methyl-accepting chemotaxis protein
MFFRNALISTRLSALTAVLLGLTLAVGGLALRALGNAEGGLSAVYERGTVPLVILGEALGEAYQSRSLVVSGMGAESSDAAEQYYKSVSPSNDRVAKSWVAYRAGLPADDQDAQGKARQLEAQWNAYAASGDRVIGIAKSGDFEGASSYMRGESLKRFTALREAILSAMTQQRESAHASFEATRNSSARFQMVVWAALATGLMLGAGLAYLIVRSIRRPLQESLAVAERVAAGNLSQSISSDSRDELGQLLNALSRMQGRLLELVSEVRRSADSIATASSEISNGTYDLSVRTEKTATNLQATSSALSQFSGTLLQNADAARQATLLSGSAAEVARRGGAVVTAVVSTMEEINSSSHRITDIISVIDGIAFQTNILALNAAVEAARAGEQGRGFAVVASEVRSLAGRSAEAAKEIKSLIAASGEKVESGTRLVADAGRTMTEIVGSVQRVSDLIAEVASASVNQSEDVEHMSSAFSQLDQVTQQNAALVEESAAAAESLKEQAANLVTLVSVFKLD